MAEPLQKQRDDGDEPEEPKYFSKLGIEYPNTIRDDRVKVGRASLARMLKVDEDGLLVQDYSIEYDGIVINSGQWSFKKKGTGDEFIRTLDEHWQDLEVDFKDAVRQATYYQRIKCKTDEEDDPEFTRGFLHYLAEDLFEQKIDDEGVVHAKWNPDDMQVGHRLQDPNAELSDVFAEDEKNEKSSSGKARQDPDDPLTTISQRLGAMRAAAEDSTGYSLDDFEEFIFDAESQMERIRRAYDEDGREEGLQLTAGDPEGAEDWDRGEDEEAHDPEAWRGEEQEEVADYSEPLDEEPSLWEDSDDVDEERETEADSAMLKMSLAVERFSYSANQVWTIAAAEIHRGHKPQRNDEQIKLMETFRDEALKAYEEFRAAVGNSGSANYELLPVFELFEDEKKGPIAKMQKAIDMAKKPARLEIVIKKEMTKQRLNDELPGP